MTKSSVFMYMPKGIQREERPTNASELWTQSVSGSEEGSEASGTNIAEPTQPTATVNPVNAPAPVAAPASEQQGPAKVELDTETIAKISNDLKARHPNASPEDLTKFLESAKAEKIEDLSIERGLQEKYSKRIEELKANPANVNLTKEQLFNKAKELVDQDLKSSNPWDFMASKITPKENSNTIQWGEVSKNIVIDGMPIELTDDSPEALNEAISQKIQSIRQESEDYASLDDEGRNLAKFVTREGLDGLSNYLNPDRNIQKYMSMSDADKMVTFMKQQYGNAQVSDEDIISELDDMKANMVKDAFGNSVSEYDSTLKSINHNLKKQFREAQQIVLQRSEKAQADKLAAQEDKDKVFLEKIRSSVDGIEKFMGLDIPKSIKDFTKSTLTSTELNRLRNNEQFLLKAYYLDKFGDDLVKAIRENSFTMGRNKGLPVSANLPIPDGKNRVVPNVSKPTSGAGAAQGNPLFGAWGQSLDNLQTQ